MALHLALPSTAPPAPAPAAPEQAAQAAPLATLLALAGRARTVQSRAELGFVLVNDTHALVPYREAALWWADGQQVAALSGVSAPEANAPYVHWLQAVLAGWLARARTLQATRTPLQTDLLVPTDLAPALAEAWAEWLPAHVLCVPLGPAAAGAPPGSTPAAGCLLLARDEPWSDAEQALLDEWAAIWWHAHRAVARSAWARWLGTAPDTAAGSRTGRWLGRGLKTAVAVAALAAMALPVPLTVLAPAELVPLNPAVVRAPLDGVVGKVLVQPNERVRAGQPLFEFDRTSLESRLEVARKALGTVQADYRNKSQRALVDPEARAQLAVLQGQIDEKATEVRYLGTLNQRGTVPAPRAGVALFGDATEWLGKPVVTGEKVMVVADEHAVELEAWLSPADALPLAAGSPVKVFLNTDPLTPLAASLRYVAHEAVERPDGHPAYRVRATLAAGTQPRVGLKGTARLEGESVPLGYWVLRRPLAAARAWLGL
jgi:hypothetical protein